MKSKTYLSILLQQFRSDTPIYSDNLILAAKINAYSDRLTFIEFLSQPNFREQEFIQKFDWQKKDFKYGLEFAFNMELNGGHIENAQIILNSSTINGLQFFYDFIQNEYLELCNLQNNPFWLFPLWEEFHKTNNLQFMNNLSPFLQGIFLYFVWKEILQNNQKLIYSLEQFLTITYEQLPVKAFMIFVGKVTEPLIRKSFDIRHQEKIDINKRLLNQLLQWMAQTIGKETLENEIIEIYLQNLKGKVNRESWLAALYFANKLEELDHSIANDNAHLIRIKVLDSYPNIWLHGNAKNHNFLSGEKSIAMISELAVAILKLYRNQAFEIYWSYSRIVAPPRLWHLQNIYEYNTYTNKRTLIFIHSLLLAKMLEKSVFPPQMIERFHSYIKLIFRQITVNHIYLGEQLVVQHLLGTLGVLYEKTIF